MCVHFYWADSSSFFTCGRHLFHSHYSLFAVRWMLNNTKKKRKKNKNKKHCRVCLQQFWKMRSCKCVLLYKPHFEFADSICASNGCMWFLCTCVCVWMCAYVHEWVMMEKQTKFCFYSSYIFPRRLKKQLFLFSFNRSSIHFTLYPNAFHFRRQMPIQNSICSSYSTVNSKKNAKKYIRQWKTQYFIGFLAQSIFQLQYWCTQWEKSEGKPIKTSQFYKCTLLCDTEWIVM